MPFSHLHVHTEFSPLDGMSKIDDLILRAKELGQPAIAVTDHGSTSAFFDLHEACKKHDFKGIYGSEFYFQNVGDGKRSGHVILLAKNNIGLENLYHLQYRAYTENFYYKPRLNMQMLADHSEGLICLSACMANQIAQYILADEMTLALSHAMELKKIFGDDFYLEIQSSTMPDQIKVNKKYAEWINDGLFQAVITNDVHYTLKEDAEVHEVLLAIQQNKKMSDPKRWKFDVQDYWLKSEIEVREELLYLSSSFINDCCFNIKNIVDSCNVTFESGDFLPHYMGLSKDQEDILLAQKVEENYETIFNRNEHNLEFYRDVQKELGVIAETGYSGYFLIVAEYANWARGNNILVGDGRGSGAGSKVAYTLGITDVNPQRYGLLFERFLSPGRVPDFDIDFSDIDAVFKHLQDLYGATNVARVGAFNRMTCKSALRKVMGVYGFTQAEISRIVGFLPQRLHFTLGESLKESEELFKWFREHTDIYYAIAKLEGVMSHMSTHAGGVIICPDLHKKLPVLLDKDDKSKLVIGLDKIALEAMGHYKFDILGLKSLTQLDMTLDSIEDEIDWHKVDYDDPNVYQMLSDGNVLGVFQLSEQAEKVIEQQPNCFEDLIAINALIRPGVGDWNEYINRRRTGRYCCSDETPYLASTSGVIVYQEQYLLLANTYAGWDIAYSDKYIRKNADINNDHVLRDKFIGDGLENGYSFEVLSEVWDDICKVVSSGYGFNRSHSTSYARLSFQTAYLKHYYPKEFYAALLTMEGDDKEKIIQIKSILDRQGIPILNPDINLSTESFLPTDDGIRFRLTSINGVGGSALHEIARLRPINSFSDFMARRVPKFIKINTIENLIKSGAFDFTGKSRYELLCQLDETKYVQMKDYEYEKEALGFYLADSPYEKYDTRPFESYPNDTVFPTVGEISDVSERFDKNGNPMAFVTAVNKHGSFRVIVFTKMWTLPKTKELLVPGNLVFLKGRKDKGSMLLNEVEAIA